MKRRAGLEARGQRVIYWDPNRDHEAHQYKRLSEFFSALDRCDSSGKGFRIAYTGEAAPDLFEDFARGVWSVLDGRKITRIGIEEYSDCCYGPGALNPRTQKFHRRLWTQSRKYGGIIDATSQRPQLISKDALDNAGQIWASSMGSTAAARVGKEIDVHPDDLRACQVGEFYHWQGFDAEKIKVFTPRM